MTRRSFLRSLGLILAAPAVLARAVKTVPHTVAGSHRYPHPGIRFGACEEYDENGNRLICRGQTCNVVHYDDYMAAPGRNLMPRYYPIRIYDPHEVIHFYSTNPVSAEDLALMRDPYLMHLP